MVCLNYNSLSLFHMKLLLNTGAYDLSQTREIIRNCWVFFFKYIQAQAPSSSCFMVLQFSKDLFFMFSYFYLLFLFIYPKFQEIFLFSPFSSYSTSTFSLLYFIPCLAGENGAIVFQWCLSFFLKKKKQLLSKSILLALSFPGSLAV